MSIGWGWGNRLPYHYLREEVRKLNTTGLKSPRNSHTTSYGSNNKEIYDPSTGLSSVFLTMY